MILLFLLSLTSFSQEGRWEFGGGTGSANYLGEIGGTYEPRGFIADLQWSKTRPGFTGFVRYNFTDRLAFSAGLAHGWIEGADSLSLIETRFTRNLSFRNQIFEVYSRFEVDFFDWDVIKRGGRFRLNFSPFGYLGVSTFYHNPKAYYQGQWVSLRPLQTEGFSYSNFAFALPVGFGMHMMVGRHHKFTFEVGWRKTFTDYLDDVSSYYLAPGEFSDPTARALADRSYEVNPDDERFLGTQYFSEATAKSPQSPGIRGNPETMDSYIMSFLSYSFVLSGRRGGFSRSRYSFSKPKVKSFRKSYKRHKRRKKRSIFKRRKKHFKPHF